jgi:hypothetical protein
VGSEGFVDDHGHDPRFPRTIQPMMHIVEPQSFMSWVNPSYSVARRPIPHKYVKRVFVTIMFLVFPRNFQGYNGARFGICHYQPENTGICDVASGFMAGKKV